jgi:hypothetical protein
VSYVTFEKRALQQARLVLFQLCCTDSGLVCLPYHIPENRTNVCAIRIQPVATIIPAHAWLKSHHPEGAHTFSRRLPVYSRTFLRAMAAAAAVAVLVQNLLLS